ncbi:hypothetical protein BDB00DRAFT_847081 [Zychaea mexicana]|uniref:uncharacterized protein n=1 Tax=Zychaea mexicana TaxID=64656 RepID=UPI0022FDDE98|nr:uncharacterized protein BDB00DRAFT_847081 [Zychaea mexicana]KAI9488713.1 hypothetical protein BDB00DRAFT_847081 [Zychaea mexicana]
MSSTGGTHITRALWRKRGAVATWFLDRQRPCRNFSNVYNHKPHSLYCALLTRSHFVSSAATVQVLAPPQDHVVGTRSNNNNNNNTRYRIKRNSSHRNKNNNEIGGRQQQQSDPLKERLSMLNVEKATRKDLQQIWKLFLQREQQLQQQQPTYLPPLVTVLFRLVAEKGTIDMMDTLHKRFLHRDSLRVEDIEWVIFGYIRANKTGHAHRLLNDMYKVGQMPTVGTYNQLIKEHSQRYHNKRRRQIAQHLLDDMRQHGVQPNATTYKQLLISEANHGSDKDVVQVWLDQFLELQAPRPYKRTQAFLKKLVRVLSTSGHPGLCAVLTRATDAGFEFDMDTWHKAIAGYAFSGNVDGADQVLDLVRQRSMATIDTYQTLICTYLRHCKPMHMNAAIHAFQLMLQDGIAANHSIYHEFLVAYTKNNDIRDDDLRVKTLRQLFRASNSSSSSSSSGDNNKGGVPDTIVERLFDFYIQHQVLSEAEQLYWDLRRDGHRLSRRIQGCVFDTITAFAQRQQLLSAFSLMYDLIANDYWPNSQSICAIIKACGARRDLDAAEQMLLIMEDISSDKLKPVVYATLKKEQDIASRRELEEEEKKKGKEEDINYNSSSPPTMSLSSPCTDPVEDTK